MKRLLIVLYKAFRFVDRRLEQICSWALVSIIFSLLIFGVMGIVLRWFNSSPVWIEPLVRHLVFFTAFFGGIIATGRNSHISIDILSRYFQALERKKIQVRFNRAIFAISSLVAFWLGCTSYHFFEIEMRYGKEVLFGLKSGHLVFIIPFGFFLISYRYFFHFLASITLFSDEELV